MNYKTRFFNGFATLCLMIAIKAIALLFAWNNVMPTIWDIPQINYQQAICLVVVATSLFNSHRLFMIESMLTSFYYAIFFAKDNPNNNNQPPRTPNNIQKTPEKSRTKKKFKK